MDNIKLIALTLLMSITSTTSANEILSVIGGKVRDIGTGETLLLAKVRIKDTNRVSTANHDGVFTVIDVQRVQPLSYLKWI